MTSRLSTKGAARKTVSLLVLTVALAAQASAQRAVAGTAQRADQAVSRSLPNLPINTMANRVSLIFTEGVPRLVVDQTDRKSVV